MPNHVLTIGLCGRDYRRLEAAGKDDIDFAPLKDANLCSLVAPLPDDLRGIVASDPLFRYRNKISGAFALGDIAFGDQWEQVELHPAEIAALVAKHGASNWYDWQTAKWGTKWGTYNTKTHVLGGDGEPVLVEFQSAWCPPSPKMMRRITDYLCREYMLTHFTWIGHDPYDGHTHAVLVAD